MTHILLSPARFGRLLASDTKNISRDPTLVFALLLAIAPAFALAYWQADLDRAILNAFDLPNASVYVATFVLTLPAFLAGWVTGFLLLEDRDDGPLLALDITPMGKPGFFSYRAAITALFTAIVTAIACMLVAPQLSFVSTITIIIMAAIASVAAAFILPAVARNKVEGLAVTKVTNLLAMAPLLAAIPSPWRYIGGIVPTYWVGEIMGLAGAASTPIGLAIALGLATHIAALAATYWLVSKREH